MLAWGLFFSCEEYIKTNMPFSMPIMACVPVAQCMNLSLMQLLQAVQANGGVLSDGRHAIELLNNTVVEQMCTHLPASFDDVALMLDKLLATNKTDLAVNSPVVERLIAQKVTMASLTTHRSQFVLQIFCNLGLQTFMQNEGPSIVPKSYLPPLALTCMQQLLADYSKDFSNAPCLIYNLKMIDESRTWQIVFSIVVNEAYALHDHCQQHDGKGFDTRKTALRDELLKAKSKKATADAILTDFSSAFVNRLHMQTRVELDKLNSLWLRSSPQIEFPNWKFACIWDLLSGFMLVVVAKWSNKTWSVNWCWKFMCTIHQTRQWEILI